MLVPTTIVCVGGYSKDGCIQSTIELFDSVQNRWRLANGAKQKLRNGRSQMGVACVGTKMFVVGGWAGGNALSSVECLDFVSRKWMNLASLLAARRGHSLVVMEEKYLFTIGGWRNESLTNCVEYYDISRNVWFEVATMNVRRENAAAVVYEGKIFVVGGHDGKSPLNLVECYNPFTNMWTPIASMLSRRYECGAVVVGAHLYAIGGLWSGDRCERYSFAEKKWTEIKPLLKIRGGLSVASLGQRIFAIGNSGSVEVYDTETGEWSLSASLNEERYRHGVASLFLSPRVFLDFVGQKSNKSIVSTSLPIEVVTLNDSSDDNDALPVVTNKSKLDVKHEILERNATKTIPFVGEKEQRKSISFKEETSNGQTFIEHVLEPTPVASTRDLQIASAKARMNFCPKCSEPIRTLLEMGFRFCVNCRLDVAEYVEKHANRKD